jgi:hypothetical protein
MEIEYKVVGGVWGDRESAVESDGERERKNGIRGPRAPTYVRAAPFKAPLSPTNRRSSDDSVNDRRLCMTHNAL